MRHRRADVVDRALALLAEVGLPDLTMRRLGAELGVQASAIYHHFASKQELLGAVADEILARGGTGPPAEGDWAALVTACCTRLRAAVLAYPDGADVVATMFAFGLGARAPYEDLHAILLDAGLTDTAAGTGARTLLHYVYGHAFDEQAHAQAARLGAIGTPPREDDFAEGLALLTDGIAARLVPAGR